MKHKTQLKKLKLVDGYPKQSTYLLYDDESGLFEFSTDVITVEAVGGTEGCCWVSQGLDLSFMSIPEFRHCSKNEARNSCEA